MRTHRNSDSKILKQKKPTNYSCCASHFVFGLFFVHSFFHPPFDIISIFHGCMVWIEKSVTRVTDRHHEACRVMPNSDPD